MEENQSVVPNVPSSSANVQNISQTFNIQTPDADSFKKSQTQISSQMTNALQRGAGRNRR